MKMMTKDDLIRGISGLSISHKSDSSTTTHNVGNKVLPITESITSSSSSSSSSSMSLVSTSNVDEHSKFRHQFDQKQEKIKGIYNNNKAKALVRLKELMKWAATVKAEKGGKLGRKVLHFRNKSATMKSRGIDEGSNNNNNESPKISLRWEVESCSTTCSVASAPPCLKYHQSCQRKGSWITTDDDFVVLEL